MTLPISPNGRRYGALKSKPDARDYGMASLSLPKVIPSVIDLTEWCGPVRDQGDLGACTAFAGTAMSEFLWRRYKNQELVFSPLYLYYQERALDGDRNKGDTGSTGRTCVKALKQFGVCSKRTILTTRPPLRIHPAAGNRRRRCCIAPARTTPSLTFRT
jgi:hypothetical protein